MGQWIWKADHIYGNSADAWAEMFEAVAPDYSLLGVLLNNMVWAHRDVIEGTGSVLVNCAYDVGYLSSDKRTVFDMSRWLDEAVPRDERLKSMQRYLETSKTRR